MSRYQTAYYYLLVVSLLVTFSPFKLAAYFLPFLGFFFLIFLGHRWIVMRNIFFVLVLFIFLVLGHAAFEHEFLWHTAVLSLITLGSVFFALSVPAKGLENDILLSKSVKFCRYLLFFESGLGILQAFHGFFDCGTFDGAIGDYVTGTISPFVPDLSFSNPIFAVNVSFLIFFLLPHAKKYKYLKVAIVLGSIALLFSSVMHVLAFFLLSFFVGYLFVFRLKLYNYFAAILVAAFFFLFLFVTQRDNLNLFASYAELFWESKIPKAAVTERALNEIPNKDFSIWVYGVGPGQFVSRAGLIGTGMYLGSLEKPKKIPLIPTGISPFIERYVVDLWEVSEEDNSFRGSFVAKPWYSWLVVFTEYGLIGFVFVFGFLLWLIIKSVGSFYFKKNRFEGICLVASIVLFALIGLVENYWEASQAVFCGILLMKIQFSHRMLNGCSGG